MEEKAMNQETHFSFKDMHHTWTESEETEKGFQVIGNQKKARKAILTTDKIDFKLHMIKNYKEGSLFNDKGVN